MAAPRQLDYAPLAAEASLRAVRRRLAESVELVSRDWWVPQSYEGLAELARRLATPPYPCYTPVLLLRPLTLATSSARCAASAAR